MIEFTYASGPNPAEPVESKMSSHSTEASGIGRRASVVWRALAALAVAALLATACEGDNLFSESATDFQPRLAELSVPDAVAGSTVPVRVEAFALRGVAQIVVSARGAVSLDTVIDIASPATRVSRVVEIEVPATPPENELVVAAWAFDTTGKMSRVIEVVAQVQQPAPALAFHAVAAPLARDPWSGFSPVYGQSDLTRSWWRAPA